MLQLPLPLDAFRLVYWIGIVLTVALAVLGVGIVVRVVRTERDHNRREALKPDLRTGLFDRLRRDAPDWDSWADGLTATERDVLRELLNEHLRLLEGSDRDRLQPLAAALGVDRWAIRTLETDDRYTKLTALGWLALLDHPHDPTLIERTCSEDAALRAAGARVMLEQEYANATEHGIRLLLDDPTESLTAFGLDTLYELTRSLPDSLAGHTRTRHEDWTPTLLVQVLRVLRTAAPMDIDSSLEWIVDQCEHESPAVRAAAIRALADSGWRAELRSRVTVEALTNDRSPAVRTATYQTLGAWRVPEACERLAHAARTERNPRCRLSAVRAFSHNRCHDRLESDLQHEFSRQWNWVAATRRLRETP